MPNHDLNQDSNLEKLIQAICWKLYLENDSDELKEKWEEFSRSPDYSDKIQQIIEKLANIWKEVYEIRFGIIDKNSINSERSNLEKLWKSSLKEISKIPPNIDNKNIDNEIIKSLRNFLEDGLKENFKTDIRKVLTQKTVQLPFIPKEDKTVAISQTSTPVIDKSQVLIRQFTPDTEVSSTTQSLIQPANNLSTNSRNQSNEITVNDESPKTVTSPKASASPIEENSQNPKVPQPQTADLADSPNQEVPSSEGTQQQLAQTEAISTPIIPPWQYHPVPYQEPEPHSEFDYKSDQSPEGLKLIGARVRGKMHKHQGTNCDDWFEFSTCGQWTIIAVADGAGSKKFSRIGAKVSCETAVKSLENSLKSYQLKEQAREDDLKINLKQDQNWMFIGEEFKSIQQYLYKSFNDAYNEVEKKANYLKNFRNCTKAVGKKELDIKDLSATLLIAVHTKIKVENSSYDFVLTCQVGDGILAAISQENTLQLLGKPDIGEHGGQTDFLTSKSKLSHPNLVQKTFAFLGNLKALMIMTDGVADDYFPNDPGMLELYGDLVLNQVINIPNIDSQEIEKQPQSTNFKKPHEVQKNQDKFQDEIKRILARDSKEPKRVSIRSIAKYAEQLGKSIEEVLASPDLLNAGILTHQMCPECEPMKSEEKLKIWLDSYYRRGSFDDRTLVVLYREEN
ncbi:MAG: protein phosphatase 2C domain-containing protein [Planktothrix rubescens PR222]